MGNDAMVRRWFAGLISLLLVFLVTYHGPASAAETDGGFSVDDFAGNSIGPRTLVGGPQNQCGWTDNHSMTTGSGTMRVDLRVPDTRGCTYASIGVRWTAPTSVNIEQGGADRIVLKYRDVVPNTPSAVVFGLELVDVNGRKASVGGLSRNGGAAGDFLTIRYAPEYVGDVSYLTFQGGFDKSRVKTVTLLIAATSGNTNVSVTFEGIGTNVGEPAYMAPSWSVASAYEFPANTETTHSFTATGFPAPDVSWTGKPEWMTISTNETSQGRQVTMTGNPGTAYGDHSLAFHANVANSLTADTTVRVVVPSPISVSATTGDTRVGHAGPFEVGTVSATPAATSITNASNIPPGTTLGISGNSIVLNGTPTVGGTFDITATVGNEFRTAVFERRLVVGDQPRITAPATQYLVRDEAMTPLTATVTGYPDPNIVITGLPDGLTATNGVISGTPWIASTQTVTIAADNAFGSDTASFDIHVGDRPDIEQPGPVAAVAGTSLDLHLATTGAPTAITVAGLPAGLAATLTAGVVEIVGTPQRPASVAETSGTATITVSNVFGSASRDLEWTVSASPLITGATSASTTVGAPLTPLDITITGYPAPTVSVTNPAGDATLLPAGLTLDDSVPGLVTISGTPSAPGTEMVRITADNAVGTAAVHDVTISALAVPAFPAPAPRLVVMNGTTGDVTVAATGFPAPTLSADGPLPAWLAFDASAGTLTASPDTSLEGTYGPFRINAANVAGVASTDVYVEVTSRPSLTAPSVVEFPAGSTVNESLGSVGGFPVASVTASGLPDGLALVQTGNTFALVGTVTAPGGAYPITLAASNGVGDPVEFDATVTITTPPTLSVPSNITFIRGMPESLTPTVGGFPRPTVSATGLPPGITIDTTTGELSGTPELHGIYEVTLTTVGGAPGATAATATVEILVAAQAMLAGPLADATFPIHVAPPSTFFTVTGFPLPDMEAIGLPPGMRLESVGHVYTLTGAPTESGVFHALLRVYNSAGATLYPWVVTVIAPPDITAPASAIIAVDEPVSPIHISATGHPKPNISVSGLPAGLMYESTSSGVRIVGTPTEEGTFSVVIIATNSTSPGVDVARIDLTVVSPPAFGPDDTAFFEAGITSAHAITYSGDPTAAVTTSALPAWLTFDAASRQFSASPSVADVGSRGTVTVTASSLFGTDTMELTYEVTSAPTASPSTGTREYESGTVISDTLATVDGDPVPSVTAVGLPTGLSVGVDAGELKIMGLSNDTGSHDVIVTLSNGTGSDHISHWTIVINEDPAVSAPGDQVLTIGAPVTMPVSVSGYPVPHVTVTGLPDGLTWSPGPGGGIISGTPTSAQIAPVTVIATSPSRPTATAQFSLTTQHAVITVTPGATDVPAGSQVSISATGFQPGETVDVELHSTPVLLARLQANNAGQLHATVTIPRDAEPGAHHLVVRGSTGATGSSPLTVYVRAALASTGTSESPLRGTIALIVAGLVLIAVRRELRSE